MKNILAAKKKSYALWFVILTAAYFCIVAIFYWLVRGDWYRSVLDVESVSRGFTTAEMKAEDELRQTLTVPVDYLMEMTVEANVWGGDAASRVRVAVEQDGKTLWSRRYSYAEFKDGLLHCTFARPLPTHGKAVTVSVSAQGGLALWCGDTRSAGRFVVRAESSGALTLNGDALQGQMVLSFVGYNQYNVLPYFWPVAALIWALAVVYGIHGIRKQNSLLRTSITVVRRYQYLLRQLVSRDFRVKYQASALGVLWSFLNPMLMTFVYYVVFSTIFKSSIENFIIYLMSGIILFNYFSEATSLSLISVVSNAHLITKVYIPKYIFPISKIISSAINLVISFVPLFVMMALTGVPFRKSLLLIPILIGITLIVQILISLTPGDPARMMLGAQVTPEKVAALRDEMGLNDPFWVRYGRYMWNLLHGDFGTSYNTKRTVLNEITQRFPYTLKLVSVSMLITILLGIPLGVFAASGKRLIRYGCPLALCALLFAAIGIALLAVTRDSTLRAVVGMAKRKLKR